MQKRFAAVFAAISIVAGALPLVASAKHGADDRRPQVQHIEHEHGPNHR
jgi:hypothetical protein